MPEQTAYAPEVRIAHGGHLMTLLDQILGTDTERKDYDDFANRYRQGPVTDGYDDDEVVRRYREIGPKIPADVYEQSAEESFNRLSPDERRQFAEWVRNRAQQQQVAYPELDRDPGLLADDPHELARATNRLREGQPSIFEQLLGKGGTGGTFDNPIVKGVFAGLVALAASKLMGRR